MSSDLYKQINYTAPVNYFSGYIVEYDLSKANISALLSRGIIDSAKYEFLKNSDKQFREVYIGNLIRENNNIYKEIQAGIIQAKKTFVEINNIEDDEILEIRNDAIFVLTDRPMEQQVSDHYFFAKKSIFTFFFRFYFNNEFFYRYDNSTDSDVIEVKGIKDDKLILHQNYMLKFLADTVYSIERSDIEEVIDSYNEFYINYLNKQLDVGFYREFNSQSGFRIPARIGDITSFILPSVEEHQKYSIDINYNLRILRDLFKVINSIYFSRRG